MGGKEGRKEERKEAGTGLMGEKIRGLMARSLSNHSSGEKNGEVKLCFCSIFLFYWSKGIPTRSLDRRRR